MYKFDDRYQVVGIPYPDPATVCRGQCEGTGWYPVFDELGISRVEQCRRIRRGLVSAGMAESEQDRLLWRKAHLAAGEHGCDGWHVVTCLSCNGTGTSDTAATQEPSRD